MSDKLIGLLRDSRLFSGFTQEQLLEVVSHMQPRIVKLKDGERVYKKGEPAVSCWLILSGNLTVKRASLRTPFRRMIYLKGSVTGIQGLADPGTNRVVTMIADGKVELLELTYEGTSRLESQTQILLWKNVSKLLLRKLSVCLARESSDS